MAIDLYQQYGYTPQSEPSRPGRDVIAELSKATSSSKPKDIAQSLLDRLRGATQKALGSFASTLSPQTMAKINTANKVVGPIASFARGGLQGLSDSVISAANLGSQSLQASGLPIGQIPYPDFEKGDKGGLLSRPAQITGNVVGGYLLPSGIYSKITKALPLEGGIAGIAKRAAAGSAAFGATSQNQPGGREAGLIGGGILGPLMEIMPQNMADNIVKSRNSIYNFFKSRYQDVFKQAKDAGVETVPNTLGPSSTLFKIAPKKYTRSLSEFFRNPTLENAHWAQSDLGALGRHYDKVVTRTSMQNTAANEAETARQSLKDIIQKSLKQAGGDDLSGEYNELGKGYAKEVLPYTSNENIDKYMDGKMKPQNLVKNLANDDAFMLSVGKNHPGLNISKNIKPATMIGTGSAAGLVGGHYLLNSVLSQVKDALNMNTGESE